MNIGQVVILSLVLFHRLEDTSATEGIAQTVDTHLRNLSPKETTAFYISMVVLLVYISLIVLGVYAGSHLLLGITGSLKGSPLYDGLMFLVMLCVGLPSLVYGLSTETFRTAGDCVDAFCTILPPFAHFLVTMLVAAQLMQTLEYTNIDALLGITDNAMRISTVRTRMWTC